MSLSKSASSYWGGLWYGVGVFRHVWTRRVEGVQRLTGVHQAEKWEEHVQTQNDGVAVFACVSLCNNARHSHLCVLGNDLLGGLTESFRRTSLSSDCTEFYGNEAEGPPMGQWCSVLQLLHLSSGHRACAQTSLFPEAASSWNSTHRWRSLEDRPFLPNLKAASTDWSIPSS